MYLGLLYPSWQPNSFQFVSLTLRVKQQTKHDLSTLSSPQSRRQTSHQQVFKPHSVRGICGRHKFSCKFHFCRPSEFGKIDEGARSYWMRTEWVFVPRTEIWEGKNKKMDRVSLGNLHLIWEKNIHLRSDLNSTVGMCISITEADVIHTSLHCQWSYTLRIHM